MATKNALQWASLACHILRSSDKRAVFIDAPIGTSVTGLPRQLPARSREKGRIGEGWVKGQGSGVRLWWQRQDSNLRPRAYESPALPLSYAATRVSSAIISGAAEALQGLRPHLSMSNLTLFTACVPWRAYNGGCTDDENEGASGIRAGVGCRAGGGMRRGDNPRGVQRVAWFNLGAKAIQFLQPGAPDCYVCPLCMRAFTRYALAAKELTLEHVPPESLGGRRLVLTCRHCNNRAGAKVDSQILTL